MKNRDSKGGRRHAALSELDDDIRDHLERETDDNIARGMTPEAARDAARRKFGNIAMTKEDTRAVWIPVWLDQFWQDLQYALRMLRRSPGFSAVVILTLALGIGMNTAVFSVVNAVLLRPLSYPAADRVVWVATFDDRAPMEMVMAPEYLEWRDNASSVERMASFSVGIERIAASDETVAAKVATVSPEFWDLSGATPSLGRLPDSGDEALVLTHGFFERAFSANPSVVGRPIAVNGRQLLVAAVLPRSFRAQLPPPPTATQLLPGDLDAYHMMVVRPPAPNAPGVRVFNVLARLKPGVSPAAAQIEFQHLRENRVRAGGRAGPPRLRVMPYSDKLLGAARTPLSILLAAVVAVLAIACANIANLLLARGSARGREIAVRAALGAGRGRMLRQFAVESLALSTIGGVAGLFVAKGALAIVLRLVPHAVPRLAETTMDARVLVFAVAVSVVTALVFGAAPAIALWQTNGQEALKDGAVSVTASRAGLSVRKTLVAVELALASVLLVSAGLMLKSLWRITAPPAGFQPDRVLMMKFQPQPRRDYVDELLRRVQSAPGVEAAGIGSPTGDSRTLLRIEGAPPQPNEKLPSVSVSITSAGYASAVGMRVLQGRWVTSGEPAPVVVINEFLARHDFAGQDPIGRRIFLPTGPNAGVLAPIVGVVADLRTANLERPAEREMFVDYEHTSPFGMNLAVRTTGNPMASAAAIRTLLADIDKSRPIFDVNTLETVLSDSIAPRRFNVMLLGTFAASAFVLALIGIYGVIAYAVSQRTREIGVRMALGAERRDVMRMVVRQGMSIAIAGLAAGLAAALAVTRVMTSLLYDVTPTDPATFAIAIAGLAAAALAACCGPALKAARVDPIIALRCE